MYPVSEDFLNAVKANTRKCFWTGRITTTAGTVYEFDQDDMVKGSGYITSQCCGSIEEVLWGSLVDHITVHAKDNIVFTLIRGMEIKA